MSTGWDEITGLTNHADLKRYVSKMKLDELVFVHKDCHEAIKAMPTNRKNSYYADTAIYCAERIQKF